MTDLIIESNSEKNAEIQALAFCKKFCSSEVSSKYIFGRNVYANRILESIDIDGFIDDYYQEDLYLNKKVIKSDAIPDGAIVLAISGGRPLSVKKRLDDLGVENLDYFSFKRFSGLPLEDVVFNEGFEKDYDDNKSKYEWIYGKLEDEKSKEVFKKLITFRKKYNIEFLDGFTFRENEQYFEDFLGLRESGETFVDVGCFNGFTSLEFIKYCPEYKAIHFFEPEPKNYEVCKKALEAFERVYGYKKGLGSQKQTLKISAQGSGSHISKDGEIHIDVDTLDSIGLDNVSFIKIDIEGVEADAIEGAANTIRRCHPRLAIAAYHKAGDFWKIPEQILGIRSDYKIYMRHYTESIYETVMFFIPK